jgi:hypothetical protein
MTFEIIDEIISVEVTAVGNKIREICRLREEFGDGRWRKLKGHPTVRLLNGRIRRVEVRHTASAKEK